MPIRAWRALSCSVLTGGVALAFLTGDLFTLFVAFELILVSSYVLLTHQGHREQVRSGMTYVVMNLFASTLFLLGVAFVYSATGTVNMARLAERIPELPSGVRMGIGLWFLVVFGTKAAIFPLFSWLPDSYPTAPTTITAVFAGLLTKVGVYALIRFNTLTAMDELGGVILVAAGVTMIVGVAGALAQDDVKRILSFHVISQIGYMLMGLGLFSVAGVAGAILFLVHQIPVKTVLFLVGGLIEDDQDTSALDRVGGLAARRPLIALCFALPALSLAGLPPFSGFVAKLALVDAGVAGGAYVIVVVSLVGSLLTLLSMSKIWLGVFWGTPTEPAATVTPTRSRRAMFSRDRCRGGHHPGDRGSGGSAVGHERESRSRSVGPRPLCRGGPGMSRLPGIRRVVVVVGLVVVWCALWGQVSVANLASGTVVAIVVSSIGAGTTAEGRIRVLPLVRFCGMVAADLVVSTASVAREVLTPTDRTDEAIIAVEVPTEARAHRLLLVVAVTVTPGTAVVDIDPDTGTLYLHLLHYDRAPSVIRHVGELAALACLALPAGRGAEEVAR